MKLNQFLRVRRGAAARAPRVFVAPAIAAIWMVLACAPASVAATASGRHPARIFVLMVWDGLRPDFVSAALTPALFAMQSAGVRFARHHAVYPTITMVDAASIATGAPPGRTTIVGDDVSMLGRLAANGISPSPGDSWVGAPVNLENSSELAALNGPRYFNGALIGAESLAQQVRRAGGYVAIIGKHGPTFVFDDSVTGDPAIGGPIKSDSFMFVDDRMVEPAALDGNLAPAPPRTPDERVTYGKRDTYFAEIVIGRALEQARAASLKDHPALVVFWQHNPDITQHHRGLGTQANLDALKICDANLAGIRKAIATLKIADRTDVMVVSDHGFATIRATVPLAQILAEAGLKKSGDDVIVVPNGGTDLIDLSRAAFPTMQAQRATLQKIVDFIAAQPWAGPLFTRGRNEEDALFAAPPGKAAVPLEPFANFGEGWIPGTFSLDTLDLIGRANYLYAPDLVVSFREIPEASNSGLMGPQAPSYVFDRREEQPSGHANRSEPVIEAVKGLMYADTGGWNGFTTGMGMHAAAGERELHNFCAAIGPDFRRHFFDRYPSGNLDVRPTIARVMGLRPDDETAIAGRALEEAIAGGNFKGETGESRIAVSRALPGGTVSTRLKFLTVRAGLRRWRYLDGVEYQATPVRK
jgi:type I phosphodiesterase/nucleotide pyrophosphatase